MERARRAWEIHSRPGFSNSSASSWCMPGGKLWRRDLMAGRSRFKGKGGNFSLRKSFGHLTKADTAVGKSRAGATPKSATLRSSDATPWRLATCVPPIIARCAQRRAGTFAPSCRDRKLAHGSPATSVASTRRYVSGLWSCIASGPTPVALLQWCQRLEAGILSCAGKWPHGAGKDSADPEQGADSRPAGS
jgi:hypothetical protein